MQQNLHSSLDPNGAPSALALFRDESHMALYAERTLREESYCDYRRHAALLLPAEAGLHRDKAQPDLLGPNLLLSGAYKCVKCSKVGMLTPGHNFSKKEKKKKKRKERKKLHII